MTPLGHLGRNHSNWIIPVVVPNATELTQFLRKHGFDATCQSSAMQAIISDQEYEGAAHAQSVFSEVLYLPIYHPLGNHGYQRLAQLINQYYQGSP